MLRNLISSFPTLIKPNGFEVRTLLTVVAIGGYASMTGNTNDGKAIRGSDEIVIVPPEQ